MLKTQLLLGAYPIPRIVLFDINLCRQRFSFDQKTFLLVAVACLAQVLAIRQHTNKQQK